MINEFDETSKITDEEIDISFLISLYVKLVNSPVDIESDTELVSELIPVLHSLILDDFSILSGESQFRVLLRRPDFLGC